MAGKNPRRVQKINVPHGETRHGGRTSIQRALGEEMPTDALLQFGKARVGHGVQGPQGRQRPLLVGSGKPAISGAIGRRMAASLRVSAIAAPRCVSESNTISAKPASAFAVLASETTTSVVGPFYELAADANKVRSPGNSGIRSGVN